LKNLEIEGIGLSPMVVINIKNPLTLPLKVNGSISDGVDSSLSIEDVEIDAAGYDGSDIVVVERKIVLADKKPSYECIFVPLNINELVNGSIPSKIDVNLNIGVDSNVSNTLYIDDDFRILYDYSLELPVAFNNELNINYQYDIENLDDLFDDLKEYDIKVGDVTIIAEVMNTLPIGINASVELRDKEGNATSAQLEGESASGAEFVIAGSVDGVTPEYTKAELDLIVDGGRIAELAKVSQIHLDLQAEGEAAEVAITYGNTIAIILDFIIVAFAIFCMVKAINGMRAKAEELKKKQEEEAKAAEEAAPPAPPAPSAEEVLLTEIRDLLKAQK
jgi:large conductance mechanosensitive channel